MQAIVEATSLLDVELKGEAAAAGSRMVKLDEDAELSPSIVQVCVCYCEDDEVVIALSIVQVCVLCSTLSAEVWRD